MPKWKIYFEAIPHSDPRLALPAGWYGGRHTSINQAIYMRTPDEGQAVVLTQSHAVIDMVRNWRDRGYPCYCTPPIIENYGNERNEQENDRG